MLLSPIPSDLMASHGTQYTASYMHLPPLPPTPHCLQINAYEIRCGYFPWHILKLDLVFLSWFSALAVNLNGLWKLPDTDVVLHPWGSESLQWRGSGLCLEKLPGDLMGQPSQSDSDFKDLSSLALMCWQILKMMALLTPFPYLEMFPHDLPPSQFSGPSLAQTPLEGSTLPNIFFSQNSFHA